NAISVATYRAPQLIHQHERLIRQLEKYNGLERKMENLPDDETLASRISNGGGLFRPELAVLMAYNKMTMFQALLDSDVPEDPFLFSELERYFPAILSKRFTKQLSQHRLRREIIATHVTNRLSHRVDPSFTLKLSEMTGCGYPEVTRAYAAAHEIYAMDLIWSAVESLDNQVQTKIQQQILIDAGQLIESGTIWLLCNRPIPLNINATVELFRESTTILWNSFPRVLAASNRLTQKRRVRNFLNAKVPADLANRAAGLVAMSASLDIVDVAQDIKEDVSAVATVYFELGDRLGLHWLRDRIGDLDVPSHWHSKAKFSLRHHLYRHQRDLVATVLASTEGKSKARVRQWILDNHTKCDRLRHIVTDLRSTGTRDFAMLSVAVSEAGSMLAGNIL
ncbi:MAG: NAD-glutamate dehydrogenase, partial [Candidatus Poribacteria bacterium]|nr:NAD-glutamate dehydrogenase [Candidatus Poribacteria bacterium]